MAKGRSKPVLFGSALVADRFSGSTAPRAAVHRGSVTEYTGLSRLGEALATMNRHISMPGEEEQGMPMEERHPGVVAALNFSLSIPPRVPLGAVSGGEYREMEDFAFNHWKGCHRDRIFERNIEIWRQFWITCERADTIAQIVDARDPEFFINHDIFAMYPHKKHLILCNKADLAHAVAPRQGLCTYSYSTRAGPFDYPLAGKVGLIGYPNVGKSSTINHILQQKRVRVSATPGKTKHIQTIETPGFTLIDCPGLVFPGHSKIDLALHGVLNVDQIPDLGGHETYVLDYIGRARLRTHYRLAAAADVLQAIAEEKEWPRSKCLRHVIKDYAAGLI